MAGACRLPSIMTINQDHFGREFIFTDEEFLRICQLIRGHAGISLTDAKKDMVYSRLVRRLRARKLTSFADYLKLLDQREKPEWEAFVNALTTNLTAFFREPHHFKALARHIAKIQHRNPLNIWCSASSSGEEAYSIAMTVADVFGTYAPPVKIIASDIDTEMLKKASAGIYSQEQLGKLPAGMMHRYFSPVKSDNGELFQARKELRDMIIFRQINLLDDYWPIRSPFEVIFCRNVMIYFDKPTQLRILRKFVPLLRRDGLLYAGHSENLQHAADLFRLEGETIYTVAETSLHLTTPVAGYSRPVFGRDVPPIE